MTIRFYILILCLLASYSNTTASASRSKVVDLGRVIYNSDESTLLRKMQGFEGHTNVAVKIYTTFRLHKNYDVDIIYTKELSGDNTIAIIVQTGWMSTITSDYEPSRYKDDLHIDRTENLNKQNLLPATMVEEIRRRMVDKFLNSTSNEQSKNLYYSLDYGVELLASLIYNPVAIKGSLIWESLWNRTDPYIMPEIAGFIDGCYNTYKSIPETDDAVEAATEVARDFAFNYTLNRDGYRDAVNNLVTEALTNLDTYIKLANGIVAAEDKIVNIYKGTTPEDRYWRGIIVFEVASAIFPLSKTKTAAKSASGIREMLSDLKNFKIGRYLVSKNGELSSLLKNASFKEIYSNLISGVTTRKFAQELAVEEEAVFKFYTNSTYYKFNKALIEGSKEVDIVAIEDLLNHTLDKIPSTRGTFFRGIGKEEIAKIKNVSIGDKITYENFLSTSADELYAWRFLRNNQAKTGEGAFVKIISKNGKDIGKYSDAAELEILHKSKSTFYLREFEFVEKEILNIDDVALSGAKPDILENFYRIVLEEK